MKRIALLITLTAAFAFAQTRPTTTSAALPDATPTGVLGRELDTILIDAAAANPSMARDAMLAELAPMIGALTATADEEAAFIAGRFDDVGNRAFAPRARQVLQDFKMTVPAVEAYLDQADRAAPLTGVRLEIFTRLQRASMEQLKHTVGGR